MKTDIRESAARAAREWFDTHPDWQDLDYNGPFAFIEGYLCGHKEANGKAARFGICRNGATDIVVDGEACHCAADPNDKLMKEKCSECVYYDGGSHD